MAVVRIAPDLKEGALAEGFLVPRDTALRSILGKDETTACEYRTAHDVTLWPIEIVRAEYLPTVSAVTAIDVPVGKRIKSAIRLRLRTDRKSVASGTSVSVRVDFGGGRLIKKKKL